MNNGANEKQWPMTVEEAVDRILVELPEEDKEVIKNKPSDFDMIFYHHGLGTWVRNKFGLWQDNEELLRSCGCGQADDASSVILRALWQKLQGEASVSDKAGP